MRSAQLVDALRQQLDRTLASDVIACRSGCQGAAAMLTALAERVEKPGAGGPGPIATLADHLAWLAQAPRAQARFPRRSGP